MDETGTQVVDQWIRLGVDFGVPDSDVASYVDDLRSPDLDLDLLKQRFGSADPDADFNGDSIINAIWA